MNRKFFFIIWINSFYISFCFLQILWKQKVYTSNATQALKFEIWNLGILLAKFFFFSSLVSFAFFLWWCGLYFHKHLRNHEFCIFEILWLENRSKILWSWGKNFFPNTTQEIINYNNGTASNAYTKR